MPASPIDFGTVYRQARSSDNLYVQNNGVGPLFLQGVQYSAGSSSDFVLSGTRPFLLPYFLERAALLSLSNTRPVLLARTQQLLSHTTTEISRHYSRGRRRLCTQYSGYRRRSK